MCRTDTTKRFQQNLLSLKQRTNQLMEKVDLSSGSLRHERLKLMPLMIQGLSGGALTGGFFS